MEWPFQRRCKETTMSQEPLPSALQDIPQDRLEELSILVEDDDRAGFERIADQFDWDEAMVNDVWDWFESGPERGENT